MMRSKLAVILVVLLGAAVFASGQTDPSLENGFKAYGSYDGTNLFSVNEMNGAVTLHIPMPFTYPQRGGKIEPQGWLSYSSNNWQVKFVVPVQGSPGAYYWNGGGVGGMFGQTTDVIVYRTWEMENPTESGGNPFYDGFGYYLTTADGATHQFHANSSPLDPNGDPMVFDAVDTSGFHLVMSNPDPTTGVPATGTLTDRKGNVYALGNWAGDCQHNLGNGLRGSTITELCNQHPSIATITDANGNVYTENTPSGPMLDTMGRTTLLFNENGTTNANCVTNGLPLASVNDYTYAAPNGDTNHFQVCYATLNFQTEFGVSGVSENQAWFNPPTTASVPVTVIFPDGTWVLNYDSYGNLTYLGLPLGGSVSFTWGTIGICQTSPTPVSRAVLSRTTTDNNGHSFAWNYNWGTPANGSMTNTVTDALGNDTVHVFTALDGVCGFYETRTQHYQGTGTNRTLLKQVDTGYSSADLSIVTGGGGALGNVVPTSIQTTVFPSGKVSLVTRQYDTGLGSNLPIFGNVTVEKEYDWGQGSPGALLRETDNTYQWQTYSAYLTAHLLDLPATVIVKDGSGCALSETDYTYDESNYLTSYESTVGTLPSGTHVAAPAAVGGNPTTVTRWLAPTSSCNPKGGTAVMTHTNWYNTGEAHLQIDALDNTTTHSYDPAYAGAYSTETCQPPTNGVNHCVSGTYDFITGLLTTFTNENATSQASGTTPGDSAHTTTYAYDSVARMTSATFPPDPDNAGAQAQTKFNYPNPITLPFTVTKTKSITPSLTDSVTSTYDGLGRVYETQHPLPNGTAEVDTAYDGLDHVVSVTNPYFSTSDPTYGTVQTQYDALGRPVQVTKQDGSISTVAYDYVPIQAAPGDCTKSTDEAGKLRMGCTDGLGRLIEVHEPGDNFSGSQASGTITLSGSLQTHTIPGTNATTGGGSVTINGSEQWISGGRYCADYTIRGTCVDWETNPPTYDTGTVTIMVNGHPDQYNFGQSDTSSNIAAQLASIINNDGAAPVSASASGSTVQLTSRTTGSAANYSLSSSYTYDTGVFSKPSFTTTNSGGALTGGTNGTAPVTVYDQGTVTVTTSNGASAQACYGVSGACPAPPSGCPTGSSTAAQLACILAAGLSGSSGVSASASGATINVIDKTVGSSGDSVSVSVSSQSTQTQWTFSPPSFSGSSATLSGGYNAEGPSTDFNYFVTQYSYDGLGNLLTVTQMGDPTVTNSSQWRVRNFTYDTLGRLLTAQNPESGTINYAYDADGNLLEKTSPAPNQTGSATQAISYCYDALNRVTGKAYAAQSCPLSSPVVSYTYDFGANAIGKLTSVTDQTGSASYSYDVLDRMSGETRTLAGITKSMSYTYNLDGSLQKLTNPSGAVITYTPDSAGRDVSAVDTANAISYATGATYGPDSSLTGFVSGQSSGFNGVTNSFSYNSRLQPVTMSAVSPAGTVFSLTYNFNFGAGDNGNVFGITNNKDTSRNQSFTYDSLNRLISAQNAGTNCSAMTVNSKTEYWGNSYGYDAWGNLLAKTVTKCSAENLSVTVSSAANNQLVGYGYDAAGNMTSDPTDGMTATYDPENRILTANGVTTYTYDADGNRVEKSGSGTGTLYWYMSPGIVAESDLSGNLKSEYVFFDGERVARRDGPNGSGGVFYYFSDHLKTTDIVTNAQGTILNESDFYPWGGELEFSANDSNHYKFTGKERDTETGLDYFGARYYSNGLGRFINADWSSAPIPVPYADFNDPQSLNLYSYVRNVPTSRADLDGHDWPSLGDVLNFAAGAANAYGSDNLAGAGRMDQSTTAGKLGQAFGDAAATVTGTLETLGGVGGEVGGTALDATGVGAIAGVPINIGSAGLIAHGGTTAATSFVHLLKDSTDSGGNVPNPDGSKGAADHQAKVNELVDKANGEAKAGETVESNKQVKGLDSTRRPDAQIVDAKGKTRKVFEAERRPNSARNKKREAEYKKLKVKQETHPLK